MKTIILFEFEGAYLSKIMNVHDKYRRVRLSGESFKISERTIYLFDELIKKVFDHLDEMSIAFVSKRTIADRVFNEVTSLEGVNLPVIRVATDEAKDEMIKRLSESADRIIYVGPNARVEGDYDCEIVSIVTEYEMTQESWLALTQALKI